MTKIKEGAYIKREEVLKLQKYKLAEGCDEIFVCRDDVLELIDFADDEDTSWPTDGVLPCYAALEDEFKEPFVKSDAVLKAIEGKLNKAESERVLGDLISRLAKYIERKDGDNVTTDRTEHRCETYR